MHGMKQITVFIFYLGAILSISLYIYGLTRPDIDNIEISPVLGLSIFLFIVATLISVLWKHD